MTTLDVALGRDKLLAWRLDPLLYTSTWDSGEGAYRFGGRWNSVGVRAVYCSLEAATCILELAVHKGFAPLDRTPHTLSALEVTQRSHVHVVDAGELPNPNWLYATRPSAGQQEFGDALLRKYQFLAVPSVVSRHSWNLVFVASRAQGAYQLNGQERFALDTRLHPPQT